MRILITGVNGFVGSHLIEYILKNHTEVHIIGLIRHFRSDIKNLQDIPYDIQTFVCDMTDAKNVYDVINDIKPDKIFHLAAQSYVKASWDAPVETLKNNISSQINLFEAVRKIKDYEPVIQIAGSSEEYGMVKEDETPITEEQPLHPLSPYGVSKVAQDLLGYQYHKSYGMKIIRTRAFNHTGARRGEVFAESDWAKQIVQGNIVKHGNLEAIRDYTDVRDTVRAYWLLSEQGIYGDVYNICTGNGYRMSKILKMLIGDKPIKTEVEEDRMRPSDVPVLIGDNSKLVETTGWKPEYSIEQTLDSLLTYWRDKI